MSRYGMIAKSSSLSVALALLAFTSLACRANAQDQPSTSLPAGAVEGEEPATDELPVDEGVDPACVCPRILRWVCGDDGESYPNDCVAGCHGAAVEHEGRCSEASCDDSCPSGYAPVCGDDEMTYDNYCIATCNGMTIAHEGPCLTPDPPECACPTIWEPVCGDDGVTYGSSCEAACADARVLYGGECPPDAQSPHETPEPEVDDAE